MIAIGFYKELETLKSEIGFPDADFSFLENEIYNPYQFLHGNCHEFAMALSKSYGYKIEVIKDADRHLIHAYCITQYHGLKAYVDVRGITTDEKLFFDEFADWVDYNSDGTFLCRDENDGMIEQVYPETYRNWNDYSDDIVEYPDENLQETARNIISGYPDYYDMEGLY